MSELTKITPKPGMIVPLPDGNGNLPAEGKTLILNSYWYQRKFDGDVTFDDVPVEAQAVTKESPANRDTEVKPAGK
jgi:hypothetical protein